MRGALNFPNLILVLHVVPFPRFNFAKRSSVFVSDSVKLFIMNGMEGLFFTLFYILSKFVSPSQLRGYNREYVSQRGSNSIEDYSVMHQILFKN